MRLLPLDQLNSPVVETRAIPYEQYFREMDLELDEIEERIDMSRDFEKVFKHLFILLTTYAIMQTEFEKQALYESVSSRYQDVLTRYGYDLNDYPYLVSYSYDQSSNIVDTTIDNISNGWYLSDDRAMFIAENETNTSKNYIQWREAIAAGKTHKRWITKRDRHVRKSHVRVDGVEIPIMSAFQVGEGRMMVPKDASLGASAREIVNCRCVVEYFGDSGRIELTRKKDVDRTEIRAISDQRFNELTQEARKNGATVERGTPFAEDYLDRRGADAATAFGVMFFRKNVTASEAVEESYHIMQEVNGIFSDVGDAVLQAILREIDAQHYVINNSVRFGIPRQEVDATRIMLSKYKRELDEYCAKYGIENTYY